MPNTKGTRRVRLDVQRGLPFCLSIWVAPPEMIGVPVLGIA